ncbi:unnamed protein product [Leptosia nina]|uniref:Cubilin n=1 Tax=Leptosia nina TaxID=320188 RepID=A0AAV1JST1_9NEOP
MTTSHFYIQFLFLLIYSAHSNSVTYQDRPKIKTSDGDLIIESAHDRNIYIKPNGPKSKVFVGNVNIIDVNTTTENSLLPPDYNSGRSSREDIADIIRRIERLESASTQPSNQLVNITYLTRRINTLSFKVRTLQSLINSRGKDECQSHPCENGGTCLNLVNGFYCICPHNWKGVGCNEDVNECKMYAGTDLGCQNGATCINTPGSYECICKPGWFGLHCTRKEKNCTGNDYEICGHGTCLQVNTGVGIKCLCEQGWTTNDTSIACLTDVNECTSSQGPRCSVNPPVDCINIPGSFVCGRCPSGYEGDGFICRDIDECLTLPNGGCSLSPKVSCYNTIGSRICGSCPPGYEGDGMTCTWRGSCRINGGGCHPSAQCIETPGFGGQVVQCICPIGMAGDGVERTEDRRGVIGVNVLLFILVIYVNYVLNRVGGVLDAKEGSIIYPPTNTTYKPNARCAWVIHTAPDKVLNVTFSKFNLEHHADCYYDFVQIHDGRSSASQLIGRFCGRDLPNGGNIVSSHNNLYFWFRSDQTISGEGFALHWKSIDPICGAFVDATTHGRINSPGSPGKYPPNRDCYWRLITNLGKRIQLHFFQLDLETHPNCSFDYLAIYDGLRKTDPLLSKFCNSTQPAPILSAGPEILIHFHSDAYGSGKGFQITYAPAEGVPGCGGFYTSDKGELISPVYNEKYLNNLLCDYKIQTNPETKIRLTFKSFNLERSFRCRYDYLVIYDGPNENSRLVGKFCGANVPKTITSTSNTLFFRFKSDQSISSGGFHIAYESVCHKTIMGDSGIVKSPGYPFKYPKNTVCEYVIGTSPGKIIELTFQDFDIEDNRIYNCQYDFVEVRDGPNANSTLLGKYCGGSDHIPPTQTSSFNYLYLGFHSDMSISGTGFYANYTTLDTECGGIFRETTGLINHPAAEKQFYRNDQSCTWLLIAPEGMHIKLTWNRFNTEKHIYCESDYVELLEFDENNENSTLGKYCGNSQPPAITTSSNRLLIKFRSDSSLTGKGFSVSYAFLDEKLHCGGVYIKTHGYIYSPGWPANYEPNRDCTWTITVPVGQQIALNISEFDLEMPIRDKCDMGDYLEIRDGGSQSAPLMGKLCGSFKSKRIVSTAHNLYIRFHSDFYLSGKGFKLEWDGTIRGCGGKLTSVTGSISSPNYPQNYNDNAECFYKIVTSSGSRIRISFIEVDLESTANCRDDYVEIYDGRDVYAPSLGKYCTENSNHTNIQTTSNHAFIKFRSDIFVGGKGFLLNYETICNTNITSGSYGVIESPGYPSNYPLNLDCLWTVVVGKGNRINVTFTNFDIFTSQSYSPWLRYHIMTRRPSFVSNPYYRSTTQCTFDYLQFKEVNEENFSNKYCGRSLPPSLTTHGNTLQIKFVTAFYNAGKGFRLEWVKDGCGAYLKKSFGSFQLVKNIIGSDTELECEWLIETPPGTKVTVGFDDILLKETANCTVDAIEMYNGQSSKSHLLAKLCHRGTNAIQSSSNFMMIKLIKKSTLRSIYVSAHFDSFTSGCGGHMVARSGILHSENYPRNYNDNSDCFWYISVPNNHRIELNILDLDLYSNDDGDDSCGDSIKIYEATYIWNSNYTNRICPGSNTSQIITNGPNMVVEFTTDSYGTAKGFKANYTATCGAVIEATYDGTITNDKYVTQAFKNCTWVILAPDLSQRIKLTIEHISIPRNVDVVSNKNCPGSFLIIFDGNDIYSPILGEYCGHKVPPMIISYGSALTIMHGTYADVPNGYFTAHYSTLSNACGGTLTSEEGLIASPNYPLSYPLGIDCEWTLQSSVGNGMYVTFETFDLAFSDRCNEDYLEIREKDGAGKLLGLYCGNDIPLNNTSGSMLYIKFHSDDHEARSGFLAHFGILHENVISGKNFGDISSPLYPHPYERVGTFTWRIISSGTKSLNLIIDELVLVQKQEEFCNSKLIVYDGYDEESPILEELCGIIRNEDKILKTRSSIIYLKFVVNEPEIGAIFHLKWSESDSDTTELKRNCGFNQTKIVTSGQTSYFHSPKYPEEYGNDLKCEWLFEATEGHHLQLRFTDFKIEETSGCYADHVSIYSRNTNEEWSIIKEKKCLWEDVKGKFDVSQMLKVIFETDISSGHKGFSASVTSQCGGVLLKESGVIELTKQDRAKILDNNIRCNWTVHVRPGRTVKLFFEHFNITNSNECNEYVMIRNGESYQSPLLGIGKYCGYSHESREVLESSSSTVYVSYVLNRNLINIDGSSFHNFKLRYEEKNIECGITSTLDSDHKWEIISSPNYPSVPMPYSECIWVFTGPPGEILRVDFIDRFDVDKVGECKDESIELHNGGSALAPLLGVYCGQKPGTIKSSSNAVYIKFTTRLAEPRNGFKANISVDVCGGTIVAESGELTSPGYPHMLTLPSGTVCQWQIISPLKHSIKLFMVDLNLPEPKDLCKTNITFTEIIPGNKTAVKLKEFCSDIYENVNSVVETSTNEVTVTLFIGNPSEYNQISEYRGFKLTFNSSRPTCGGKVTQSEGYITTPGYPRGTVLRYCQWIITVPDRTRRIKLEIMDYNDHERIGIYNDATFESLIDLYLGKNGSQTPLVYESTGNTIAIYLLIKTGSVPHDMQRFKAKFSSNEPALCGDTIAGDNGVIIAPDLERSYICKWTYNIGQNKNNTVNYNTMLLTIRDISSMDSKCYYSHSRLIIDAQIGKLHQKFSRSICGNNTEVSYRIPLTSLTIKAVQITRQPLTFSSTWKIQPCGGIIHVTKQSKDILNIPKSFDDTLDCGWIIVAPIGEKTETKVEGTFNYDCSDEFITINHGLAQSGSTLEYCKDKLLENALITTFKYTYVQYHSKPQRSANVKLVAKISSDECGGYLSGYDRVFSSPNYPNSYPANVECTWIIQASVGYRVSLSFVQRFVIEDTTNCTKDVVIIYDWKNEAYNEVAKLCGRQIPAVFNSTSTRMKVVFRTDANTNLDGFMAQWSQICGGQFIATEKEQFIYSPGYGSNYDPLLECFYEIKAPNQKVTVKFLDFALEGFYPECKFDNVTIGLKREYEIMLKIFCGKHLPTNMESFEEVTINFKTDAIGQDKGFKLSYSIYTCGRNITEPAIIKSSESSEYYNNMNCTWTIQAPQNKHVIVKFSYIDLESHISCYNDYVAVFDGSKIEEDKRLALLCGNITSPTVIKSKSNNAIVQFVSDEFLNYRGFRAQIAFSYGESVGCGGTINLLSVSQYTLKSPLIGKAFVYENYLDCHWTVTAPEDRVIRLTFTAFHVSPCVNVNQTAVGINKCDCDFVEVKDGLSPDSLEIGKYCGHTLPPDIVSSDNLMAIRLYTDGEIVSSGFEITLRVDTAICAHSEFMLNYTTQIIRTPGFENGAIPRGLHCIYNFKGRSYDYIRLRIQSLDLQSGTGKNCDKDKLIIRSFPETRNMTLGSNYVLNRYSDNFFMHSNIYDPTLSFPEHFTLCGASHSLDLHFTGSVSLNLITSPESPSTHKGVEIEASLVGFCGRNYTEAFGRIQTTYIDNVETKFTDCYTLITAPEDYTISIYFNTVYPVYYDNNAYLEILDGDKSTSPVLLKIGAEYEQRSVFSTGRYLLMHNHIHEADQTLYDLNYVVTNKGRGCGGKLVNELGRITSPLYPDTYRKRSSCEWELETPIGTRLLLHFSEFDLGRMCDQNYLSLVDRSGSVISTYCSDTPADYTSEDNYVKVVFDTSMNNGGTGWVADFIGIL